MKIGNFCFDLVKLIGKFYVLPTLLVLHCRDYATKKIEIAFLGVVPRNPQTW